MSVSRQERFLNFTGYWLTGTIVALALGAQYGQAQTYQVLYFFAGSPNDGANPHAGLIRDSAGNLYGTTRLGGNGTNCNGVACGVVFELDSSGTETVLYNFAGPPDGQNPSSVLVRDSAGNLYGVTDAGGSHCSPGGCGTVFKLGSTGSEIVLHNFAGAPNDGGNYFDSPGLIRDSSGNLYGTTQYGGTSANCQGGCGTVFKVSPRGKLTVLHNFTAAPNDGNYPLV